MPSYQGQISEEELLALVAYLRSLGAGSAGNAPGVAAPVFAPASRQEGGAP